MYVCIFVLCVCMCVYLYCVYAHMCICMCVYMHVCLHGHTIKTFIVIIESLQYMSFFGVHLLSQALSIAL